MEPERGEDGEAAGEPIFELPQPEAIRCRPLFAALLFAASFYAAPALTGGANTVGSVSEDRGSSFTLTTDAAGVQQLENWQSARRVAAGEAQIAHMRLDASVRGDSGAMTQKPYGDTNIDANFTSRTIDIDQQNGLLSPHDAAVARAHVATEGDQRRLKIAEEQMRSGGGNLLASHFSRTDGTAKSVAQQARNNLPIDMVRERSLGDPRRQAADRVSRPSRQGAPGPCRHAERCRHHQCRPCRHDQAAARSAGHAAARRRRRSIAAAGDGSRGAAADLRPARRGRTGAGADAGSHSGRAGARWRRTVTSRASAARRRRSGR